MLASGQRPGRMPAEGQVGLIWMPTSRALDSLAVQLQVWHPYCKTRLKAALQR